MEENLEGGRIFTGVGKKRGNYELYLQCDSDVIGERAEGRPQCGTDVIQGHLHFNCKMNWLICNKNNNTKYTHNKEINTILT
jgi:hypothetical protein